ncbi:MAG: helix-turn-helix domain-containing protein [Streptosporangiaceae bacterium]
MEAREVATAPEILDLLYREAPEPEFRNLLATLPAGRHHRAQVELALQISQRLAGYRRRASELRALYETAGDLASLRDLEKVLHAIVQRSRQLLATDVSYLMLVDEKRGDTYMRVTEGTVTQGFEDIRLDLGYGLGGMVAETAVPYASSNYASDPRFKKKVNDRVFKESIIAIVGVPLKIGRRVIGVLFAADRSPREFTPEEIALLGSLATHAALAIENASRMEEIEYVVRRLTAANERMEQHSAAVERASEAHERFTELVLRGGSIKELAKEVASVFGGDAAIADQRGDIRACANYAPSGTPGDPEPVEGDWPVRMLRVANCPQDDATRAYTDGAGTWIAPVVAGKDHLGAIMLHRELLHDADIRILERAAMVTALLMVSQRAIDETNNRLRGELLSGALNGTVPDPDSFARRARLLGVEIEHPHVVLTLHADEACLDRARMSSTLSAYAIAAKGLFAAQGDNFVLLVEGRDAANEASALGEYVGRETGIVVTVGADGPVTDLSGIARAAVQSRRCVKALMALDRTGGSGDVGVLGVYGLLLCGDSEPAQVDAFLADTISGILRYDTENGTKLAETMEQYFEANCNAAQAASRLYIHTNTLYQRLDRLDRVLGPGWRSGDGSLQARLALKLWKLRRSGAYG